MTNNMMAIGDVNSDQFISPMKDEEQPKKQQRTEYFSLKDGEDAMATEDKQLGNFVSAVTAAKSYGPAMDVGESTYNQLSLRKKTTENVQNQMAVTTYNQTNQLGVIHIHNRRKHS